MLALLSSVNRGVTPSHVTKMAKSVLLLGCIRPVVVAKISFLTGVPVNYIIDGQHLYEALLRLDMPVPYVMIDIKNEKELIEKIALVNSSSKSWNMKDFIHAWAYYIPVYKKLNAFYNRYDLELSILVSILMDLDVSSSIGGASCLKHVKDGTFDIVNEDKALTILAALRDVFTVIKRLDRQQNKYVCSEFVKMYRANEKTYKHNRFMKNLRANVDMFTFATHEADALSMVFKSLI